MFCVMDQSTEVIVSALRQSEELDNEAEFDGRSPRRWGIAIAALTTLAGALMLGTFLAIGSPAFEAQQSAPFVVLMRHGNAPGRSEPENFTLADCATQRNLSDKGRIEAREAGAALRAQALNIRSVISSRWCRTRETAKLLGFASLRDEQAFDNLEFNKERAGVMLQAERDIIQNWRGPGILVVVTHSSNISALTGLELEPSSMIIAEKKQDGSIQFRASSIVLKDLLS